MIVNLKCTLTLISELPAPPLTCATIKSPLKFCPNASGAQISQGYIVNDIDKELPYDVLETWYLI